ncbi:MAG: hypothetical protein JXB45_07965 [Candidatus Krumholzibacteriota bacterium]|nr:hypothetical protein [Candidatus Krumholzibacteriota bacterium]
MRLGRIIVRGALRRALAVLAGLSLILAALYGTGEWFRRRDYREKFARARGKLSAVEEKVDARRGGFIFQTVELASDSGIKVSARLKAPGGGGGSFPALVILGGLRTGSRTIEYLEGSDGLVLLALDYPYGGKKERLGFLEFLGALPRIHRAVLETVPAVMLGVDYLLTRDDVASDRILLAGGSLGALFAPAALAADERLAGGAILFGAGDIERLVRHNLRTPFWLAVPAGWACGVLTSPIEPLKYAADISPRPLFILNGRGDPRIPARCAQLLQEAAGEPKTVKWIDAGHLGVQADEFHELVGDELIGWLSGQGFIVP